MTNYGFKLTKLHPRIGDCNAYQVDHIGVIVKRKHWFKQQVPGKPWITAPTYYYTFYGRLNEVAVARTRTELLGRLYKHINGETRKVN